MKNKNQSVWSKISGSATFRAVVIGILILLMLIPVNMIRGLIQEREWSSVSVAEEISSKWGNRQTLTGPVITVPFQYDVVQDNKLTKVQEYAHFLPEELNIEVQMMPEIRYRSIYKVVVYQSDIRVKGNFAFPDFEKLNARASFIDWENAFITIGISDLRGIRSELDFHWNDIALEAISGTGGSNIAASGVTVKLPLLPGNPKNEACNFDFKLTLNGSHGLFFVPLGKNTHVALASEWSTPSFDGAFLPNIRDIGDKQFTAKWDIFSYNRNFPQMWTGRNTTGFSDSEFGVQLLLPVDHYQKTMRSVKYAIMFIALTFLVFFLVELISHKRIHPMQYLLVSIGLILFYSLLLAISEQIGFDWAYLISALSIVALITAYSYSIFRQGRQTWMMGGFLALLYLFLYTVLQLEDLALLIGSIGLFIALAAVMYISRKVDWYRTNDDDTPANDDLHQPELQLIPKE